MTFRYSVNFPISGANKLARFNAWVEQNLPAIEVSVPPQVPIEAISMTVRLKSLEDRAVLLRTLGNSPL